MAGQFRRPRPRGGATPRTQAYRAGEHRGAVQLPNPGPRARAWLGWIGAAALLAVVAFVVGRAGSETGIASPTPVPSPTPLPITFGTALDPVSGEAVPGTARYRTGDTFAYSVRLAAAPGVNRILVEIVRLEAGTETVAQQPSQQGIVATSRVFAFTVLATDLLHAWGPGTYAMRIFWEGAADPFAEGRFTLVETPLAS